VPGHSGLKNVILSVVHTVLQLVLCFLQNFILLVLVQLRHGIFSATVFCYCKYVRILMPYNRVVTVGDSSALPTKPTLIPLCLTAAYLQQILILHCWHLFICWATAEGIGSKITNCVSKKNSPFYFCDYSVQCFRCCHFVLPSCQFLAAFSKVCSGK